MYVCYTQPKIAINTPISCLIRININLICPTSTHNFFNTHCILLSSLCPSPSPNQEIWYHYQSTDVHLRLQCTHLRQIILSQLYFCASTLIVGSITPPLRRSTKCSVDSMEQEDKQSNDTQYSENTCHNK